MKLSIFGPPEPRWPSLGSLGRALRFVSRFRLSALAFLDITFTDDSLGWSCHLLPETAPTHSTSCCDDWPRGQEPNKATKRVIYCTLGTCRPSLPACLNDTAGCVISSVRSPSP